MKSHVQILKFGGTSVGSGERIRRVAHIIANTFNDPAEAFPVVVVSAMSKVTDQLLLMAKHICASEQEAYERELKALKQKHLDAAEKAVHDCDGRNVLRQDLEAAFTLLEQDVARLRLNVEAAGCALSESGIGSRFSVSHGGQLGSHDATLSAAVGRAKAGPYDSEAKRGHSSIDAYRTQLIAAVAAWGERLSVLLVAASAADIGLRAVPVREEVIITGNFHCELAQSPAVAISADPLPEETRVNAQAIIFPLLEEELVPVAAGFIGRTSAGCVTTLGRNGSDYSASVIGAALDCSGVSIYSDVDGVLTADPRLVMNARLLPQLSYAEAARLSWFGAKVLHPRTLIPIAHRNIPVRVRNTFRPGNRGTLVGPGDKQQSGAAAITVHRHLALITVESTDLFGVPENAGQVFALAARAGAAPVAICSSSGHHLSFVVEEQAAASIVTLLRQEMDSSGSSRSQTWSVRSRSRLAACACIGSGFTVDPMSPARAITALARERIPVITQGASELGITLIVEDADSERALRSLHRDLIAPVIPLVRHTVPEKKREAL